MIWLLTSIEPRNHHSNHIFVEAETCERARALASSWDWLDGAVWWDPNKSICDHLTCLSNEDLLEHYGSIPVDRVLEAF